MVKFVTSYDRQRGILTLHPTGPSLYSAKRCVCAFVLFEGVLIFITECTRIEEVSIF